MTAAVVFDLLWRWRFTVLLAVLGLVLYFGHNALAWKSTQLKAERALSKISIARAAAGDLVINRRAARDAEREKENAALRQEIKEALARDPAARAWSDTPLPAAIIRLLQAPRQHPGRALPADTGAGGGLPNQREPP